MPMMTDRRNPNAFSDERTDAVGLRETYHLWCHEGVYGMQALV